MMKYLRAGRNTYKVSGLTKRELSEKTKIPKVEKFIRVGSNTYKVGGLTVDEFKAKTGKSAKEYYEITGKKEPVKKVEPKKEIKKEAVK